MVSWKSFVKFGVIRSSYYFYFITYDWMLSATIDTVVSWKKGFDETCINTNTADNQCIGRAIQNWKIVYESFRDT